LPTTQLITHEACARHDTGHWHPESPARLAAVLKALDGPDFAALDRREAPRASPEQLALAHPAAFVERALAAVPLTGYVGLDGDTILSPGSGEAALRAAGAVVAGVDAVMTGAARTAFCAVRPPGHHAEPGTAMGFCVFNNVGIGALHARAAHGLRRVAVVDFDVHHGNGTQALFWDDAEAFFASSHQSPLYPGTGAREERGAAGQIVNTPLPPGAGSEHFRAAWSGELLPALDRFQPELILVSAGFDAHRDDPLANLELVEADYHWITVQLLALADRHAGGRLVSTLEGGYHLEALGASAAAHVQALMGDAA
jgi:acetoin utilization deacetylase AcuC-like enzyme